MVQKILKSPCLDMLDMARNKSMNEVHGYAMWCMAVSFVTWSKHKGTKGRNMWSHEIHEHGDIILQMVKACQTRCSTQTHLTKESSTQKFLLMNTPAFFKGNYISTCNQCLHKGNEVWIRAFLLHLSKQFRCILPLPTFSCPNMMVIQVFADGILLNTFQASAMFPHFAYMSGKNSTLQSSQKYQICNMVVGNSSKLCTKTVD